MRNERMNDAMRLPGLQKIIGFMRRAMTAQFDAVAGPECRYLPATRAVRRPTGRAGLVSLAQEICRVQASCTITQSRYDPSIKSLLCDDHARQKQTGDLTSDVAPAPVRRDRKDRQSHCACRPDRGTHKPDSRRKSACESVHPTQQMTHDTVGMCTGHFDTHTTAGDDDAVARPSPGRWRT